MTGETAMSDILKPGDSLLLDQSIISRDGRFTLTMQSDGNLVLYEPGGACWDSKTYGQTAVQAVMQSDGNLVIYGPGGAIWHTNTYGHPGACLIVQDDRNAVIYDPAAQPLWATNTYLPLLAPRVLVILQENSGQVALPEALSGAQKQAIHAVIDTLAEDFEKVSASMNTIGLYQEIVNLSDTACTRQNLVNALVDHTLKNHAIHLVVLGHGNVDTLSLHGEVLTGGTNGSIRTILAEAQTRGCPHINLHMVYMCNCQGSSLNDDWLAIGAKVSIGTRGNNYMPEPMTGQFLAHWTMGFSAQAAAQTSYQLSIPVWTPFYPPKPKLISQPFPLPPFPGLEPHANIESSCPVVAGERDRTAAMTEVRPVVVGPFSMHRPVNVLRDGGVLPTSEPADRIEVAVSPGAVANDEVEFQLLTPGNMTWRKEIIIGYNPATGGSVTISTQDTRHEDHNGLYVNELPGATLTFRKEKGFPMGVQTMSVLGGLDDAAPGSRITFSWLRD
jgi:hypothetical protein